jgi:hypothetical protein
MRALFSIASLVIVLCIVMIAVQHQLRAARPFLPTGTAAAAGSSAPFGGASQPSVAQYQREVNRVLNEGAAARASAVEAAETEAGR